MTTDDKILAGQRIATLLGLKFNKEDRIKTVWGSKSPLGLYETVKRIMEGKETFPELEYNDEGN